MADVDRSDPDLKFLVVDRNAFSDPATQAEWSQKRLVWVPHESQGFVSASMKKAQGDDVEVEIVETGKRMLVSKDDMEKMKSLERGFRMNDPGYFCAKFFNTQCPIWD